MRSWIKGCLAVVLVLVVVTGVALVVVGPRAWQRGKRVALPVMSMIGEARKFEEFVKADPWKAPAVEAIATEQLDRFFAVRGKLDQLYSRLGPRLAQLPQQDPETFDEAADAVELFGDLVPEQMRAFMEVKMTPREYRYVEGLVYSKWRNGRQVQGERPGAVDLAVAELHAAAEAESDAAVATRLRERAEALRTRPAPPPDGISQEIHDLLLPRLDEIERLSLDAYKHLPLPQI